MALYELTKAAITPISQTTFSARDFRERADLQRLLKDHIDVIAPGTLVIAEEFCDWDDSRRSIDLLAIDRNANLVVIELKRTEDGGHMELQAIRYAAMISTMTFSKAVEVYARYLEDSDSTDNAETALLQFLNWDSANEDTFGQDVQIVLVSAEFSKEVTTSVLWLRDKSLDIRCVRLRPYSLDTRTLLDVQQVIPLPEAQDYTVQIRKKAEENRQTRQVEADWSRYDLTVNGTTYPGLKKRWLVLRVVKAALDHGLTPEDIAEFVRPNKWISVPGDLSSPEFVVAAANLQAKQGGRYNLGRYFCADADLFHLRGRTYALSNQWSTESIPVIDQIIAKLSPGAIHYAKSSPSD